MADLPARTTGDIATAHVADHNELHSRHNLFDAIGDLVVGNGVNTAARLMVGTNGQVLTADSSSSVGVSWTTVASGGGVTESDLQCIRKSSAATDVFGAGITGDSFCRLVINASGTIDIGTGAAAPPRALYVDVTLNETALGENALVASPGLRSSITAVGTEAFRLLSAGSGSTAIGVRAGTALTTGGSDITLIGHEAGAALVSGSSGTTAVGSGAMDTSTTASDCTALGFGAGSGITTGDSNTAIGRESMGTGPVTGFSNTCVGDDALRALTSGTHNVAVGRDALNDLTTADGCVAAGFDSGAKVTTGGENVHIGRYAATIPNGTGANATTTATRQVCIGAQSGLAGASQDTRIVAIGYNAIAGGAGAVAIGSGCSANAAGSVAIGRDSGGTAAATTVANELKLGTTSHTVRCGGGVATVQPSGTGAGTWKLGKLITAAVAADTTRYIELDVDGVLYKLIVST